MCGLNHMITMMTAIVRLIRSYDCVALGGILTSGPSILNNVTVCYTVQQMVDSFSQ